jgi:hypothetical protein
MKQSRIDEKKVTERYLELHDHFLLEFLKNSKNIPHSNRFNLVEEIICLDGLVVVDKIDVERSKFGF